jgi:CRISPR-associated protein Cas2
MPVQQFVVVSYDIVSDLRRRKVMKAVEGFGKRVQYSVFECLLTPAQIVDLQRKLKKLVGKDDSVRFYFISADDVKRIALLGGAGVTADRPFILH